MNNWCICWFFTHILLVILIFKGLSARRLYKSFGVKGLIITKGRKNSQRIRYCKFQKIKTGQKLTDTKLRTSNIQAQRSVNITEYGVADTTVT
jgi:hypothetical protein